jgi:hypothetical protein
MKFTDKVNETEIVTESCLRLFLRIQCDGCRGTTVRCSQYKLWHEAETCEAVPSTLTPSVWRRWRHSFSKVFGWQTDVKSIGEKTPRLVGLKGQTAPSTCVTTKAKEDRTMGPSYLSTCTRSIPLVLKLTTWWADELIMDASVSCEPTDHKPRGGQLQKDTLVQIIMRGKINRTYVGDEAFVYCTCAKGSKDGRKPCIHFGRSKSTGPFVITGNARTNEM